MKRFLMWLLVLLPVLTQAQFIFTTNNGAITITGYTGSNGVVVIPDSTNGYPVTSISAWAFFENPNNTSLTNIIIPDSVTSIGESAFGSCVNLASITIPNSVTNVGVDAFYWCSGLTNAIVGNGVPSLHGVFQQCHSLAQISIGSSVTNLVAAFAGCNSLTNVNIPSSVVIIDGAFQHCTSLSSVTISNGVKSFGAAFQYCTSLSKISIPDGITSIVDFDFQGCSGLTNIVLGNNIMSIGNYAFDSCSSLSSVTIGNNVGIIESYAFQYCYNLASIVIPNSITNIQRFAFNGCTSLTHVMIGSGLIGLGDYEGYGAGGLAFYLCPSLTAISVDLQNPNYSSVDGVLYDKSQTTLIQYPAGKIGNSFTISDGVTNIGGFAFNSCTSLASITTGGGIVNIGSYAFYDSGSVAMVTMRNYIDSIGDYAFSYCANLTGIFFEGGPPNSVGYDGLANNATIYYLPEMAGWGAAFAGRPTKLWLPQMQTIGTNSSMQTNQFGFNINWANGKAVVVEACTNLSNPDWQPVQTNTLADGSAYFSDPQWTNYPNRFYRLRSP